MLKYATFIAAAAMLSACASTPNVSYGYYLSKSKTTVTLAQTVSCAKTITKDKKGKQVIGNDKKFVISYAAPTVTTLFFADHSTDDTGKETAYIQFNPKNSDSSFSDIDFALTTSDDGRLKGVNASWTGQGEAILKSAVTLGMGVFTFGGGLVKAAPPWTNECDVITQFGDGKSVTVNYTGSLDLGDPTITDVEMLPANDKTSQEVYEALNVNQNMPRLFLKVTRTPNPPPAQFVGKDSDYKYWLTLRNTVNAKLRLVAVDVPKKADGTPMYDTDKIEKLIAKNEKDKNEDGTIYSTTAVVPTVGTYPLPLPGSVLFGSQKVVVTLSDAGAINSVEYAKTTGTAGPLNVLGSATSQ